MRDSSWFRRVLWMAGIVGMCAAGCRPPSVGATVVGMLTIDGRPAPAGIRIDFEPQAENGSTSTGHTDSEGRYEMRFNVHKLGVMPGESLVRVSIEYSSTPGFKPSVPEHLKGINLPPTVNVESTLRKTVKPGHNEIDIAVETKPPKK